MTIQESIQNDVLVLKLEGDLMGGEDNETLRKIIDKAIKTENVEVVIDMSKVTWMNSSGLGMLISALTTLRSSGGDLRLANLNDRLRRPIQITKLDSVFNEYDSVKQAIESYK